MRFTAIADYLILAVFAIVMLTAFAFMELGVVSKQAALLTVGCSVAISLGLVMTRGAARVRKERALFVADRAPLSNDDYLRQMGATGDYARFCLIVRDGFAIDCGAAADMIHPSDSLRQLERLCFDGFYLHEIFFGLEQQFPKQAADLRQLKAFGDWKTMTFRACAEGVARELGIVDGMMGPTQVQTPSPSQASR